MTLLWLSEPPPPGAHSKQVCSVNLSHGRHGIISMDVFNTNQDTYALKHPRACYLVCQ